MKTKQEWRTYGMQCRQSLGEQEREDLSLRIAEHYLNLFEQERPKVVHLFLPIPAKAEVNTFIILRFLNEHYPEVKTVTSVIAQDQHSLETIEVRIDTPLRYNAWGIPEPETHLLFPEEQIEEVLTPLLVADAKGYRIGYGKGFYDRFFEKCPLNVTRTGLNFFPFVEEAVVSDQWDVPLHRLIHPHGVAYTKK